MSMHNLSTLCRAIKQVLHSNMVEDAVGMASGELYQDYVSDYQFKLYLDKLFNDLENMNLTMMEAIEKRLVFDILVSCHIQKNNNLNFITHENKIRLNINKD